MFSSPSALTLEHARTARDAGVRAIEAGETDVDLAAVSSVDSSAVAVLLSWQRTAKSAGKTLRFHHLPPALSSLAALYGVSGLIEPATPQA